MPLTRQRKFDRVLARMRTVSIGCAAVLIFVGSLALTLAGFKKAIYSGMIFTIVLVMWAVTSYVYEKDES